MVTEPARVRTYDAETDAAFLFDSWTKDFGERGLLVRGVLPATYTRFHRFVVERIVRRSKILVACDPDAERVLYGYLCWEPPATGHYCFVKRPFRRLGIARLLFAASGLPLNFSHSHQTYLGQEVVRSATPEAVYNPWLM